MVREEDVATREQIIMAEINVLEEEVFQQRSHPKGSSREQRSHPKVGWQGLH